VRDVSTNITRAHTLREPTHLDPIVFETVKKLFACHCDRARKVRLVGVALSSFTHGGEQLDLLDASRREKQERLTQATDALRDRFGFSKIQFGGSMIKAWGERKKNECHEIGKLAYPRCSSLLMGVGDALSKIVATLQSFEVMPLFQFLLQLQAPVVRPERVLQFSRRA